ATAWAKLDDSYAGFLVDVQRACKAAENTLRAGGSPGEAHLLAMVAKCAVYSSTIASLHDFPTKLIPKLVEKGLWTLDQAIVRALRMPDPLERVHALTALAQTTTGPAKSQLINGALTAIREVVGGFDKNMALTVVAPIIKEEN